MLKEFGYGKGYVYPHNSDETVSYLPFKERFYEPSDSGYERNIRELIKRKGQQ